MAEDEALVGVADPILEKVVVRYRPPHFPKKGLMIELCYEELTRMFGVSSLKGQKGKVYLKRFHTYLAELKGKEVSEVLNPRAPDLFSSAFMQKIPEDELDILDTKQRRILLLEPKPPTILQELQSKCGRPVHNTVKDIPGTGKCLMTATIVTPGMFVQVNELPRGPLEADPTVSMLRKRTFRPALPESSQILTPTYWTANCDWEKPREIRLILLLLAGPGEKPIGLAQHLWKEFGKPVKLASKAEEGTAGGHRTADADTDVDTVAQFISSAAPEVAEPSEEDLKRQQKKKDKRARQKAQKGGGGPTLSAKEEQRDVADAHVEPKEGDGRAAQGEADAVKPKEGAGLAAQGEADGVEPKEGAGPAAQGEADAVEPKEGAGPAARGEADAPVVDPIVSVPSASTGSSSSSAASSAPAASTPAPSPTPSIASSAQAKEGGTASGAAEESADSGTPQGDAMMTMLMELKASVANDRVAQDKINAALTGANAELEKTVAELQNNRIAQDKTITGLKQNIADLEENVKDLEAIVFPIAKNVLLDINIAWVLEAFNCIKPSGTDGEREWVCKFPWRTLVARSIKKEEREEFCKHLKDHVFGKKKEFELLLEMFNTRRGKLADSKPCDKEELKKRLEDCILEAERGSSRKVPKEETTWYQRNQAAHQASARMVARSIMDARKAGDPFEETLTWVFESHTGDTPDALLSSGAERV